MLCQMLLVYLCVKIQMLWICSLQNFIFLVWEWVSEWVSKKEGRTKKEAFLNIPTLILFTKFYASPVVISTNSQMKSLVYQFLVVTNFFFFFFFFKPTYPFCFTVYFYLVAQNKTFKGQWLLYHSIITRYFFFKELMSKS